MMTLCGGTYKNTRDNCLTLTSGTWIKSHQLKYDRLAHNAWPREDEIILLGGEHRRERTSEVLKHDNSVSTVGFELKYETRY